MPRKGWPGRWLVRNRYDNIGKIGHCRGPVFIAHSPQDGLIPFAQGERLFAAAPEPKRFYPMPNYHHNDLPTADFYPALRRFLADCEWKMSDASQKRRAAVTFLRSVANQGR
jgi:fermentation-respiration switch protein FrsA (DUF1100 family)